MSDSAIRLIRILQLLPDERSGGISVSRIIGRLEHEYGIEANTRMVQRDLLALWFREDAINHVMETKLSSGQVIKHVKDGANVTATVRETEGRRSRAGSGPLVRGSGH